MKIITFNLSDTLILKKKHPCASDRFRVLRLGSDVRIVCEGCGKDITLPREKIEKMIKGVVQKTNSEGN